MPELPEVETVIRGLKRYILLKKIERVLNPGKHVFNLPFIEIQSQLLNRSVIEIRRHGKSIFIGLTNDSNKNILVLNIHLGMSGQLLWEPKDAPMPSHTHFQLEFGGCDSVLRFRDIRRFGHVKLLNSFPKASVPDAWDSSDNEIFSALRIKSGMIKHAILNQSVIAGVGNIYADESLYAAKIHPQAELARIPSFQLRNYCTVLRAILSRSINAGGTSFRDYRDVLGSKGGFRGDLLIYGREGQLCGSGHKIIKQVIAGRGTHFCRVCQKKSGWKNKVNGSANKLNDIYKPIRTAIS